MHSQSKAVKRQREIFSQASQHYSHLTPPQKAQVRLQMAEVEVIKSHGKTDIKLLKGRQLFLARDIHELRTKQRQLPTPLQICIILVDQDSNPLEGNLLLLYLKNGEWHELPRKAISPYDWLFPEVPRAMEKYHPFGDAEGYVDFQDPITTYLTQSQLVAYHYHTLTLCQPILKYIGILGAAFACTEGYRAGQTFSLTAPVTLSGVTLMACLLDPAYDGTLYINIEETTDGLPNGSILTQGNARVTTLTSTPKEITALLAPVTLAAFKQYAVVASIIMDKPYPHTDSLRLYLLKRSNPYPPQRGLRSFVSSGLNWYDFPRSYCFYQILLGSIL
ncbi:hypothetical protein ES708_30165 [subsurface metagenome]